MSIDQIMVMRAHLPVSKIAQRLGKSQRTIQRLLSRAPQIAWMQSRKRYDREEETVMMLSYRDRGYSYAQIGFMFGLSRQAVQQRIAEAL